MADIHALPKLITEKEAAEMLNISLATIRRERNRENISYRRIAGSIKYTEEDLIEYLDNGRVSCKRNNTLAKSGITGCHSEKGLTPGVGPGSTSVHDKQSAHRLAQMTFRKPS
jgi:hypothetical protein